MQQNFDISLDLLWAFEYMRVGYGGEDILENFLGIVHFMGWR